eukprot:2387114-Rhodomonas_salina.1
MQEYNETTGLGLKYAGAAKLHICEVDRLIKLQLEVAAKAFNTVGSLCEHMRVCTLMKLIKDGAKGTSAHAGAWRLAENMIITGTSSIAGTTITLKLVKTAIGLVQKHLEMLPEEVFTPGTKDHRGRRQHQTQRCSIHGFHQAQAALPSSAATLRRPQQGHRGVSHWEAWAKDTHPKRAAWAAQAQPAEATEADKVAEEEEVEAQLVSPSPTLAGHATCAENGTPETHQRTLAMHSTWTLR